MNTTVSRQPLLSKIICPHCWLQFPPHEIRWISAHPALRDDAKVPDGQRRFLPSRFGISGQAIDSQGELCSELACPRCHLGIPRDVVELPLAFFSILGSPSSGKSYFLASSLWQLRSVLSSRFAVSFEDSDLLANQRLHQYEDALFLNTSSEQLVALPKTELDGDLYEQIEIERGRTMLLPRPFIFRMRLEDRHPRSEMQQGFGRTICLYDNAGEHFLPGAQTANSPGTRHLAVSKALMFVFDLTQHPEVRKQCRSRSEDPQIHEGVAGHRQDHILIEAGRRIRAETGLGLHHRDDRPLIVVLSKYDAWSSLVNDRPLLRDSILQERLGGTSLLNLRQLRAVSDSFRQLLLRLAPEIVSAAENLSSEVTYVPVSALGCSPQQMPGDVTKSSGRLALGVRPGDINPVWAEVPLLYAIHRTIPGLIQKRHETTPSL